MVLVVITNSSQQMAFGESTTSQVNYGHVHSMKVPLISVLNVCHEGLFFPSICTHFGMTEKLYF